MIKLVDLILKCKINIFGRGAQDKDSGIQRVIRSYLMAPLWGTSEGLIEIFEDNELKRLTRKHPVEEILGETYGYWKSGAAIEVPGVPDLTLFSDSPAKDRAVELGIFPRFLHYAAREKKWVGYNTNMTQDEFTELIARERVNGVHNAQDSVELYGRMVRYTLPPVNIYANPTEKFIAFVRNSLRKR